MSNAFVASGADIDLIIGFAIGFTFLNICTLNSDLATFSINTTSAGVSVYNIVHATASVISISPSGRYSALVQILGYQVNNGSGSTFEWLSMSSICSQLASAMRKTKWSFANQVVPLIITSGTVMSSTGYGAAVQLKDNLTAINGRYYTADLAFGGWPMSSQKVGGYSFSFIAYFS